MKPEAFLFDLGGVVFTLDWDRAFACWSRHSGVPVADIRARYRFDAPYERHERGEIGESEYCASLRRSLGIDLTDAQVAEGWGAIFADEIPQTVALLRAIGSKVPLYALSNSNPAHARMWRARFASALSVFRKVFVSFELGARKPERAAFAAIAREIGLPLESILFFDDTAENVAGARAAGVDAIQVCGPQDVARALRPWLEST